jgi:hypothetical protein
MVITAENIFSWPVTIWLAVALLAVAVIWRWTRRVRVPWQRAFLRAGMLALCFTPLPSIGVFALVDPVGVIPLWWVLASVIREGALLGLALALVIWLVASYALWVAGMAIHHLLRGFHVS